MMIQPRYPIDPTDRSILVIELTDKGYIPTQAKHHFKKEKIDAMIQAMMNGQFDWGIAARQPVVVGPNLEILGGHHRVVAAHLAGIDLEEIDGQVVHLNISYREHYRWDQVLPDV